MPSALSTLDDLAKFPFTSKQMLRDSQGLATTPSMENARFQLALETELSRTISALRPVQSARVHLAIPKPSAFTRDRRLECPWLRFR